MKVRDVMTENVFIEVTPAELAGVDAYSVETHDGRTGSVAAVLPRAGRDSTGVLLVHQSSLSCRLIAIPFDEVELVDREGKRVLLRERAPRRARRRTISHV
jgi:hypothetical protein